MAANSRRDPLSNCSWQLIDDLYNFRRVETRSLNDGGRRRLAPSPYANNNASPDAQPVEIIQ